MGDKGAKLTASVPTSSIMTIMTMQNEQPAALSIMTFRRPALSMKKYGSQETKKYWIPKTPEMMRDNCVERPMLRSKVIGRKYASELMPDHWLNLLEPVSWDH